jgi:hypothetical protein
LVSSSCLLKVKVGFFKLLFHVCKFSELLCLGERVAVMLSKRLDEKLLFRMHANSLKVCTLGFGGGSKKGYREGVSSTSSPRRSNIFGSLGCRTQSKVGRVQAANGNVTQDHRKSREHRMQRQSRLFLTTHLVDGSLFTDGASFQEN